MISSSHGGGDLVNLSRVAGGTARSGNAVYAATKWVNGWSESLRQQLRLGMRVIVIEPGAVATELTEHIIHGETKSAVADVPGDLDRTPGHRRDHRLRRLAAHSVSLNEILARPTRQAL